MRDKVPPLAALLSIIVLVSGGIDAGESLLEDEVCATSSGKEK